MDSTPTMAATPRMSWALEPRDHVGGGTIQAQENLAVGVGFGDVLDSLLAMLPAFKSGKIRTLARPATTLSGSFARGDFRHECGVHLEFAVEISVEIGVAGFLLGESGAAWTLPMDGWVALALGGVG